MRFKDMKMTTIIPDTELVRIKIQKKTKNEMPIYTTLFNDFFKKMDSDLYLSLADYKIVSIQSAFDFRKSRSALNIYLK